MLVRPTSRLVLSLSVLFVSALLVAPAPSAQQVFKAGADVVPVYATVRDPNRGFVLDLTQDDFELFDEGRKQTITQFTIAAQPLSVVVLIDGSVSMMSEFNRAIEGARNFVLRMLPEDRAKIGSFADRVVLAPRFTSERDQLLKYLDDQFNLRVGAETHLWEAVLESAMSLGNESGKRAVVVLSDGYNFAVPPGYGQPQTQPGSTGGYPPIGGRGPAAPPTGGGRNPIGGIPVTVNPPAAPRSGPAGVGPAPPMVNPGASGFNGDPTTYGVSISQVESVASLRNVVVYGISMWVRTGLGAERPSRNLERVALDTGGAFYEVQLNDDMNTVFTDVVQQLRQQYVLGFVPAAFDDKKHTLSVRVKRPGLQVQSRRSYIATREGKK